VAGRAVRGGGCAGPPGGVTAPRHGCAEVSLQHPTPPATAAALQGGARGARRGGALRPRRRAAGGAPAGAWWRRPPSHSRTRGGAAQRRPLWQVHRRSAHTPRSSTPRQALGALLPDLRDRLLLLRADLLAELVADVTGVAAKMVRGGADPAGCRSRRNGGRAGPAGSRCLLIGASASRAMPGSPPPPHVLPQNPASGPRACRRQLQLKEWFPSADLGQLLSRRPSLLTAEEFARVPSARAQLLARYPCERSSSSGEGGSSGAGESSGSGGSGASSNSSGSCRSGGESSSGGGGGGGGGPAGAATSSTVDYLVTQQPLLLVEDVEEVLAELSRWAGGKGSNAVERAAVGCLWGGGGGRAAAAGRGARCGGVTPALARPPPPRAG
jgi:hypothetical protein